MSWDTVEKTLNLRLTERERQFIKNKMTNKYVLPATDSQISTLLTRFNNPNTYFRLALLICKFYNLRDFATLTYFLLNKKRSKDSEVFTALFANQKLSNGDYGRDGVSAHLTNILDKIGVTVRSRYLDVGCGDGSITKSFGKYLHADVVVGADVENEFEIGWKERLQSNGIEFYEIKNNELAINQTFDIISCFMVLHHIPIDTVGEYIQKIYDMLDKNGVFIIKEHDCFNAVDNIMADLEHSLFLAQKHFASGKNTLDLATRNKIKNQVIYYKNRFEWQYLIESVGFKCVYSEPYDLTPHMAYKPNRAYVAIFQK